MSCMTKLSPEAEQALDVAAARYALQTQPESADLLDKVRAIELAVKRRRAPLSALLGALMLFGCAKPSPPSSYSIDDAFPPDEREVIHSAVDAWCEATGDCPAFTPLHSEAAHFTLVDDLPEGAHARRECPEGRTCTTNARERDGLIRIARNRVPGLDILWLIAAHEYGHLCIDDHPLGSALMAAVHEEPLLEVDSGAVRLWNEGCH